MSSFTFKEKHFLLQMSCHERMCSVSDDALQIYSFYLMQDIFKSYNVAKKFGIDYKYRAILEL